MILEPGIDCPSRARWATQKNVTKRDDKSLKNPDEKEKYFSGDKTHKNKQNNDLTIKNSKWRNKRKENWWRKRTHTEVVWMWKML